jgi:thioredoxin reductase
MDTTQGTDQAQIDEQYDVVIVGGGAAGLSGALTLSRARRSVLVIDAGSPRNAPAGHVHNYLGREGTSPGELLATGRAEVTGYGGTVIAGTVVTAEPIGPDQIQDDVRIKDDAGFRLALADGRTVLARRVLVTTGLLDELPDVPGLAERWGHDVLHCPYCHGWEVRDQAIAVLATGPMSVHQALLFRQWSTDVTLLLDRQPAPGPDESEQLAARGITVLAGEVAAVETRSAVMNSGETDDGGPGGHRVSGVRLRSGELVSCQAVVVGPRFAARAEVLVSLGLETTELQMGGLSVGTYVAADPSGATAVPGVWVAGNVADPRAQVISSAAGGLNAAAAINADLIAEDTRRAVTAYRNRPVSLTPTAASR